jgi:hypothetical protein
MKSVGHLDVSQWASPSAPRRARAIRSGCLRASDGGVFVTNERDEVTVASNRDALGNQGWIGSSFSDPANPRTGAWWSSWSAVCMRAHKSSGLCTPPRRLSSGVHLRRVEECWQARTQGRAWRSPRIAALRRQVLGIVDLSQTEADFLPPRQCSVTRWDSDGRARRTRVRACARGAPSSVFPGIYP